MTEPTRVAFLLKNFAGGGIEKVTLNLLKPLAKLDIQLDLVLACAEGIYLDEVPQRVRVFDLERRFEGQTTTILKIIPPLVRYLQREKPDILISSLPGINLVAAIAVALSGIRVSLILAEHTLSFPSLLALEKEAKNKKKLQLLPLLMPILMRRFYPMANAVVTVSEGMAQQWAAELHLPQKSIKVIYNPVVDESLLREAEAPLDHPWFQPNQPPVLLSVGRLTEQKDFPTLLYAFARLREQRPARLLILGDGELRKKLQALIEHLHLELDVSLHGFTKNPYTYMSRASAFVLSSIWEGLPTVLIEAMACRCQVVSTDCPYGPSEILGNGKYGRLVPVGDVTALFEAMQQALDSPIDAADLRHRAHDFSIERAVYEYLQLLGIPDAQQNNAG